MIRLSRVNGQRFAVLGLGRTGVATAQSLIASGAEVWAWDDGESAGQTCRSLGIELCDLTQLTSWQGIDCLLVSPGIPHLFPQPHPAVAAALGAGVPLDNDVGLYFAEISHMEFSPTTIAVTGSNGKSTTAALIHSVLEDSDRVARLVGNIGEPVLAGQPLVPEEIVVLELSSYQIDLANILRPDVAIFLNLSVDHLKRHGGMGGYFAAKRRLFESSRIQQCVIGVDEREGQFLAAQVGDKKVIRISGHQDLSQFTAAVYISEDGHLISRGANHSERMGQDLGSSIHRLRGVHDHQNACAAFAACHFLGLTPTEIVNGMVKFSGLPHRSQVIGIYGGILCINDSKATNPKSAGMALQSYRNIRWILGGLGKEGGIASLAGMMGNVTKAYVIGKSAPEFAMQLSQIPHVICLDLEQAVKLACTEAVAGDTVLLAPAAASFDQYPDFVARGEHFIAAVKRQFKDQCSKN